jgi:hypothetical protein
MPAPDCPFPLPGGTTANPFPVQSWTVPRDPVTGAGWGGGGNLLDATQQLAAAVNCSDPATCSHLDYTGSTEIYEQAQFVVSQLRACQRQGREATHAGQKMLGRWLILGCARSGRAGALARRTATVRVSGR